MLDVLVRLRLVLERQDAALVVRARALVVERHESVALEVRNGCDRRIDRQLAVVRAQTMAVGVGVGEQTGLEDGVRRGLDTGDKVRG